MNYNYLEYLTTVQAAEYIGMSTHWLECSRYGKVSDGPPFVKLARAVRYRRSDLDAWMKARLTDCPAPDRVAS